MNPTSHLNQAFPGADEPPERVPEQKTVLLGEATEWVPPVPAPVVPVGVLGTLKVQPNGARLFRPFHRVEVRFGQPRRLTSAEVEAAGDELTALRAFTDALMAEISELSERPYIDAYIVPREQIS